MYGIILLLLRLSIGITLVWSFGSVHIIYMQGH